MLSVGDEPIRGYRLQKFLGRGAFGEVWKATSPGGTFVAMKFLDLSGKQGWKEFHALERIKQIRHPHILPIHALWLLDADGQVLEYDVQTSSRSASSSGGDARGTLGPITGTLGPVDYSPPSSSPSRGPSPGPQHEPRRLVVAIGLADETLKDRLETCQREGRSGIPVDELLPYMVDAARGLDFLNEQRHELDGHRVALQHCDVKPANLLVMGGSVILGDFGLVSILSNQGVAVTATGMVGSLAYMSPECIRKKPGGGSDQYSLAVTYYELRTGRLPFAAEDPLSVAEAHVRGKLDLSGLPAAEERVLRRATQIKGSARYATSQEMVEALRQAVMPPVRPRNSLVRWITSTGILAASLAGVLWYYHFGPGKQEAGGGGGGGGGSGSSSNNGQGNGGQLTQQGTDANPTGNGNGSAVETPQVTDGERLTELAQALQEFDLERGKTLFRQLSPAGQEQARIVNSRRLDIAPSRLKGLAINQLGTKLVALSSTGQEASALQTWNLDALHTAGNAAASEPWPLPLVDPVMSSGNRICAIVGNRKSAATSKKVSALVVVDLETGQMQEVEFEYQLISPYVTLSDQENAVLLTGSAAGQTRVRCWRLTPPTAEPSPETSATEDGTPATNVADTSNAQPTAGALELSEVGSELTLARMRFPKCLEFAADGQIAYVGGESKQRAGVLYGVSLDRWEEAAQEDYAPLLDTEFKITKLAWATPESLVVTSAENASDPSRVQIVDAATGASRGELLKVPGSVQSLTTFNGPAESWIACGSVQGSVAVWQLPTAGGANSAPTSTADESSADDGASTESADEASATADDPSATAESTAASVGGSNVPPRFEMLGQYSEAINLIALCPNAPGLLVVCSVPTQRSGGSATVIDLLQISETIQPRLTLEVGEGANSLAMAGSWIAVGLSPRSTANGPRDAIMVYDLTRLRLLQELQQTPVLLGPTANPASQTAHRWH